MSATPNMPEIDDEAHQNALSLIGDPNEEFPVLRAFQQYIDAEQSKARKRMLALSIFFGCLLTVIVVVFLFLLNNANEKNQALNDRLVEFAMNREPQRSNLQPQSQQDNSAIVALTARIEDLQKKLIEAQQKAAAVAEKSKEADAEKEAEAKTAEAASKAKQTAEELEIERLKALLAAEREKAAAEREKAEAERKRRREEELEAYRRKHYPELYQTPRKSVRREQLVDDTDLDDEDDDDDLYEKPVSKPQKRTEAKPRRTTLIMDEADDDSDVKDQKKKREPDDIDTLLEGIDSNGPINYFEDDTSEKDDLGSSTPSTPKSYAIPLEIRGSRNKWHVPND